MSKYKIILASVFLTSPLFASALLTKTDEFARAALNIVQNLLIPLAFALAMLFFFWGLAKYIRSEGQGKDEGRKIMIWGVLAVFVMASVWGLVRFIQREFDVNDNSSITIPKFTQ